MLEAKSMYFGGEIISADECSYQTSRELGLVCPFCSSAVFIRSESVRETKSKLQLVRPYFAHYPSGLPDNWDCEKRSRSKQGREEIERIKIQARNQRLKLYNAHLWDMFSHSHSFSRQHLNKARSLFGESWCEQTSILVRHEWGRSLSDVYTFMDAAVQDIGSQAQNNKLDEHYLLQCDIRLHHAICCEVADFLATNTAGFVFHKIFKAVLMQAANVSDKFSVSDWKRVSAAAHISSISIAIAATKWTEEIQRQSTQEVIRA